MRPTSAPFFSLLPKEGGRKKGRICAANESTRAPLTRFPFPMRGVDCLTCIDEILRLSPHLFWLGGRTWDVFVRSG